MYSHTHKKIYIRTYIHTRVYLHVDIKIYIHIRYAHARVGYSRHKYECRCPCLCIDIYLYIHTSVEVYVYVQIYVYMYIYIWYIYIWAHIRYSHAGIACIFPRESSPWFSYRTHAMPCGARPIPQVELPPPTPPSTPVFKWSIIKPWTLTPPPILDCGRRDA